MGHVEFVSVQLARQSRWNVWLQALGCVRMLLVLWSWEWKWAMDELT